MPAKTTRPTWRSEAETVLRRRGPMTLTDLTEAILRREKLDITGRTPSQTLGAILLRCEQFERVAPGTYDLTKT